MEVTSDGKWFLVDPPAGSVAEAAQRILAMRLEAVQQSLPLAAQHAGDDVEHVHQLRVNCRRAAAALRAFETLKGQGDRKLKRWLKRLRQAAGPARDADVYVARLRADLNLADEHAQQLVAVVTQSRVESQGALEKVDAKARRGGLKRAIDRRVNSLADAGRGAEQQTFAEFAKAAIAEAAAGLEAIDAQTASLAQLHQLRIAAKRLRYAIEIFHSAAESALREQAYPQVEEIQERLGAINDRLTSQLRLQQWLARLPAGGLAAFIAGLIVGEHADAERLRDEFLAWWTPERNASLREQLIAFG
jgi:CHAD domain-containing protein